jgi:hypothetical protein
VGPVPDVHALAPPLPSGPEVVRAVDDGRFAAEWQAERLTHVLLVHTPRAHARVAPLLLSK